MEADSCRDGLNQDTLSKRGSEALDSIANGLYVDTGVTDFAASWARAAFEETASAHRGSQWDLRVGRVLALAGSFLWSAPKVAMSTRGPRLSDDSAVRGPNHGRPAYPSDQAEADDTLLVQLGGDEAGAVRQNRVDALLQREACWVDERSKEAAKMCVHSWLMRRTSDIPVSSTEEDKNSRVGSALHDLLPEVMKPLRAEASRSKTSVSDRSSGAGRRAYAVVLSFHWIMECVHYSSLKDRLGLCLPVLLQVLDGCTDAAVRLMGLDALHLTLDRAMAAEMQNFLPPLEHCLATSSPLFFDGDDLAPSMVAPYCAAQVLCLLKAYTPGNLNRQASIDKFLTFGGVHCSTNPVAFRLFLEFGLIPLLRREVLLLASRVKQIMEILMQAAEATHAVEVMFAWRGLGLLLGGALRPRTRYYTMDILLRAAFGYLTFVASGPPASACCDEENSARAADEFVAPAVDAMTPAEWALAERLRPILTRALGNGIGLLASAEDQPINLLLHELEAILAKGGEFEARCPALKAQLSNFAAFAQAASASSTSSLAEHVEVAALGDVSE